MAKISNRSLLKQLDEEIKEIKEFSKLLKGKNKVDMPMDEDNAAKGKDENPSYI